MPKNRKRSSEKPDESETLKSEKSSKTSLKSQQSDRNVKIRRASGEIFSFSCFQQAHRSKSKLLFNRKLCACLIAHQNSQESGQNA